MAPTWLNRATGLAMVPRMTPARPPSPTDQDRQAALAKYLRRLTLRSDLTPSECAMITALPGEFHDIAAQRDMVSPGQDMTYACLVVAGLVARFDQLANGQRQFTAITVRLR